MLHGIYLKDLNLKGFERNDQAKLRLGKVMTRIAEIFSRFCFCFILGRSFYVQKYPV